MSNVTMETPSNSSCKLNVCLVTSDIYQIDQNVCNMYELFSIVLIQ